MKNRNVTIRLAIQMEKICRDPISNTGGWESTNLTCFGVRSKKIIGLRQEKVRWSTTKMKRNLVWLLLTS